MEIKSINIKNFKGIKSYKGDVGGKNVYLVGGNGVGKTSFLDAVWYGLDGKSKIPEMTHNGAKNGLIELDLGDFIARTKIKKGRRNEFELENKVYNSETEKFIKSPRSYMESRIGMISFDINEFFNKTGLEQVKYYSKVMGVDFSDLDADIQEAEESRKFDKRDLKAAQAKVTYYNSEDAEKEYISVAEVSKEIEAEAENRTNIENVRLGVEQRVNDAAAITKEIERLINLRAVKEGEIADGQRWLDAAVQMTDEEFEALKKKRDTAEFTNEQIREAKEAKQAEELVDKYEAQITKTTEEIQELRAQKTARISQNLNVEGLVYDTDKECFLYNGLPFDKNQTNTASQLIVGMKIGATLLKDLKILKVDASLIDEVEFNKVLEWADSEGIELFVELVDRKATQLQIKIDDND